MEPGASIFREEGNDSRDSESTFSGLGSLPDHGGHATCSKDFSSFAEELNLSNGDEGDVNMNATEEGGGESGFTLKSQVVVMVTESRSKFFESKKPYNTCSQYCKVPLDVGLLSGYCALSDGYAVHSPSLTDKMWHSHFPRWQSVPDLWFLYGFCLPMHPFFEDILKALECGIGQLSPNLVLQISRFIARCHELNHYPTLDLFFFIYRLKSTGV